MKTIRWFCESVPIRLPRFFWLVISLWCFSDAFFVQRLMRMNPKFLKNEVRESVFSLEPSTFTINIPGQGRQVCYENVPCDVSSFHREHSESMVNP